MVDVSLCSSDYSPGFMLLITYNSVESPLVQDPVEVFLTGVSSDKLYNGVIDIMQASGKLFLKAQQGGN